jgi:tRNA A-37 threonylcarbamoyl transferase component Bud32
MFRLKEAGIPTADPVFYGERRKGGVLSGAFFAALEIPDAVHMGDFIVEEGAKGRLDRKRKKVLYRQLADLTARLHRAGIRHGDYHLGNLLVSRGSHNSLSLHLIDLHTVSFPGRLSKATRRLNLARVAEALEHLNDGEDLDLFLDAYLEAMPDIAPTLDELRSAVKKKVSRWKHIRLRSRTRRCLMKSTEFTRVKRDGYHINLRRKYAPELITEVIRIHDSVQRADDPRLLHPVFKNKVTAIEAYTPDGRITLCVKEYRSRLLGRFFGGISSFFSEARRSWIAGRGLEVRRIPTPETAAWVRGRGRSFFLTQHIPGNLRLHAYIAERCKPLSVREAADLQQAMAAELALLVKRVHLSGIRHGDFSEQNILVKEEEGERRYFLIDCDTLYFRRKIRQKDLHKNLIQLGHMPEDVNVMSKARFLYLYLGLERNAVWRSLFRSINQGILVRMDRKRKKSKQYGLPDPHPRPSRLKGSW